MNTTSGRLSGKTALVTAAGQGIGRAVAEAFIREGATVIAADINAATLATLQGATTLRPDMTDGAAVRDAIAAMDPLDVLFNGAGFVHAGTIEQCSDADWEFSFNLNVRSMHYAISAALPRMVAKGGGSIINMSSVASSVTAAPNRYVYTATKAAVIGLTKSIAIDYVTKGVRCNAICPGTIDSPSLHERLRATGDYQAALSPFVARQPMGRIGRAEEVAALAVYLASDESAFTTGQTHVIDGGWAM